MASKAWWISNEILCWSKNFTSGEWTAFSKTLETFPTSSELAFFGSGLILRLATFISSKTILEVIERLTIYVMGIFWKGLPHL